MFVLLEYENRQLSHISEDVLGEKSALTSSGVLRYFQFKLIVLIHKELCHPLSLDY